MIDKCTYFVLARRIPRKSVFFVLVSRHQSSPRSILATLIIFDQHSSTGRVESEFISSSQSTVSLFWQEVLYCNKQGKHCVLGQRAPNAFNTRSQRQSLYVFEDESSISIFVSFISSIKFPMGDVPF